MECRVEIWPIAILPPAADWLPAFFYAGLFLLIFVIGEVYRRIANFSEEFTRAYTNVTVGILVSVMPCLFSSFVSLMYLAFACTCVFGVGRWLSIPWVSTRFHRYSKHLGLYPLAPLTLLFLSGGGGSLYSIPILVLAVTAGCGGLFGKIGGIRIKLYAETRTLEGLCAFAVLVFLVVHIPLLLSDEVGRAESLLIAILCAVLAVGAESISFRNMDVIVIPSVVFLSLQRMMTFGWMDLAGRAIALLVLLLIAVILFRRKRATLAGFKGILLLVYTTLTLGGIAWLVPLVVYLLTYNLGVPADKDPTPRNRTDGEGDVNNLGRVSQHLWASPVLLLAYAAWPHPAFYQAYMGTFCFLFALGYALHGNLRMRLGTPDEKMGAYFSQEPTSVFWAASGIFIATAMAAWLPKTPTADQRGAWLVGAAVGTSVFLFLFLGQKRLLHQYHCSICRKTTTHPWCHGHEGTRVESFRSQMGYGAVVLRCTFVVAFVTLSMAFLAAYIL